MASTNGERHGVAPARRAPRPRREYWRALLEECRRSGLSQAAFCRRRGVPAGTLGYWKCILAREQPGRGAASRSRSELPAFLPVRITVPRLQPDGGPDTPAAAGGELEIVLGHGRRLRVRGRVDAAWLGQVVTVLDGPRC